MRWCCADCTSDRELAKQGLLDALQKYGCLPKRAGHKASLMSMTGILNRGMQRYIADSNSALLGLQPEDRLEMATPVNIPAPAPSTRTGAGSCPSPCSRCLPMNGSIS